MLAKLLEIKNPNSWLSSRCNLLRQFITIKNNNNNSNEFQRLNGKEADLKTTLLICDTIIT